MCLVCSWPTDGSTHSTICSDVTYTKTLLYISTLFWRKWLNQLTRKALLNFNKGSIIYLGISYKVVLKDTTNLIPISICFITIYQFRWCSIYSRKSKLPKTKRPDDVYTKMLQEKFEPPHCSFLRSSATAGYEKSTLTQIRDFQLISPWARNAQLRRWEKSAKSIEIH
jgi:hypothetical protein